MTLATNGWSKTYGTAGDNEVRCIVQTSDGGYILAGFTNSSGAGGYDAWIMKTDAAGDMQWNKTYGGLNNDQAYEIIQTSDGDYAFAGTTNMVVATNMYSEWLVKLDSSGNVQWE